MKKLYLTIILGWLCAFAGLSQPADLVLSSAESGTKLHQATNSITFAAGYSYTPSGGTMTAEIVEPSGGGETYENVVYQTIIDPETRSLNTSYLVGTTDGAFNVSATGGATYTIPLDLLPGVAGLEPNLSITYNSLGGLGVAGYGWNISGISAITRSPQTYYHDGQSVGVDLTSTDRFSLDGQRLICISGSYGQFGSVYRTENDNFTKVTCYANGTNPTYFNTKTKSGLSIQYGYDSDAKQTVEGQSAILSWYANKITDVYGNVVDFAYVKESGRNYLSEITYGPNIVTFYYKTRSDKTTNYLKGSEITQNLILDKIEVKYNTAVVKKYEFKYNFPSSIYTQYSVLNEVIEYGIGSSRLNSTVFSYQAPDNVTFAQSIYNNSHNYISYKSKLTFGDFNGDGLGDVFTIDDPSISGSYTGWKMFKNNGNETFTQLSSGDFSSLDETKLSVFAVDLNGDNIDDLLIKRDIGNCIDLYGNISKCYGYYYSICSNNTFSNPVFFINANYDLCNVNGTKSDEAKLSEKIMDMDGDGLTDIFIVSSNGWRIFGFSGTNGTLNSFSLKYSGSYLDIGDRQELVDFDGNGIADLFVLDENGNRTYSLINSSLSETSNSTWPTRDHYMRIGDFNADGKTDMFVFGYKTYDWSNWQIRLSTGTGFKINYISKKKNNLKDDIVRVGDFNGDGCSDLMVTATNDAWNGHYYYISKNQGTNLYSHFYSGQSSTHNYFINDFDGDGRDDYLCTDGLAAWWNGYMIYKSGSKNKIMVEKVVNGLNQLTKINYKTLSQYGSPYTKGSGASFPAFDFQGALPVVSSTLTDNGRGTQNTVNYSYHGAKVHRQGKGFLCYTKQTLTDVASSMKTESNYDYHTTYYFPKLTSTVNKYSTTTLSTTSNIWSYKTTASGVIMPYISSSTTTNNLTGHSATQTAVYDTYGNLTSSVKTYNNGVTETTTNAYTNDATNWLLGKLTSSTLAQAKSGETTVSNTVSYTYSTDGILKPDLIKYYEGTDLYSYKNHDYFSNGSLKQLVEYGTGVGSRTTTYTYETNGVRLKTINDPLGHTTTKNYDSYGRLSSEVDYLSNTASFTYDNLSRIATVTQSDGFITTTTYNWGLTGGPTYACYNVQQSGNDGSLTKNWYDKLAREIRSDVTGFNGSPIYTVTEYNTKGQLYRISEPSTSSLPSQWNTHTYDNYGRVTGITRPSGRNTAFAYSNNRVTETTGGKARWKETDSQGLVTTAHDNGGDIVYAYFPDGKVKTISAPGGVVTTMEYGDAARNQTKLIDPSAGTIEYTYDSFGQLKTQKNARNQTVTYNYYLDGRLNNKVTPEGTTTYSYNTNKQITGITSPGSVSKSFGYDTKGRVNNISETIPGSSTFSTIFTYDSKGRMETRTHPSGIVETNHYNSNGYMDYISAGGATRFTITAMNERQQVTAATYGSSLYCTFGFDSYGYPTYSKAQNGGTYRQDYRYSFTTLTGNLYSRENYLKSKSESFSYDNLDRLTGVTGPQNLTMAYNANGNITTKSDVGSVFDYDHPTKPYALTGVETSGGLIPHELQEATYTSFEQVSTLDEGDYHAQFTYNSDDQRAKMLITNLGSTILTRWYAGSRYIKETEGSTTKEYTWIGGDAYSAPVVAEKVGSTTTYYYLLRDYLGNITHKVNTSNTVVAEYSYDAWGRRRDKDDWLYTLNGEPDLLAGRSFTSHEYLPWFKLVNMNGRLYDPVVGRFLSPDENVQMPDFSQNLNRYSYALNNPLSYIDPSGEFIGIPIIAMAIWSGYVNTAMHMHDIDNFGEGLGFFFTGAAAGVAGAWAGGATANIIGGGFLGGVTSGAAGGFAGSFVSGVGNAWVNGSNFGQGLNAGFSAGGKGALFGAAFGGAIGGLDALTTPGVNFWDGSTVDEIVVQGGASQKIAANYNSSSQADINDGLLKLRMGSEFRVQEGDFNIKKITTRTGGGYGMNSSGKYINMKSKATVGGYVRRFSTGYSHLHVSPHYAMAGDVAFRAVAGHELIHAYHNFIIPNLNRVFTERVAYKYTYDTYAGSGQLSRAFSTYQTALSHGYWGTFPAQYQIPTPLGW